MFRDDDGVVRIPLVDHLAFCDLAPSRDQQRCAVRHIVFRQDTIVIVENIDHAASPGDDQPLIAVFRKLDGLETFVL